MARTFHVQTLRLLCCCVALAGLGGLLTGCAPDADDLRTTAIEQFRNQEYIESMATLRQVLEMDRADAQANYYMGLNYRTIAARKFRQGDVTAACRELDTSVLYFIEAVKSWPNYIAAAEAQNEALEARGKYDEALAVAQHVARNNRGVAEHFVVLGNEYRERADYDNALRCYKLAMATDPESAQAHGALARLYEQMGDRALAMDAYRRAAELDPASRDAEQRLEMLDTGRQARTVEHSPSPAP